jgi:hypothetical protein
MSEGQIFVNFLFHETESKSHDFLKFITERVKKILVSKLTLFEINELVKRNLICIDQFTEIDSYFLENKTLHQVPSFTYWSDEQVNNYLTHMFKSAKVINPKGAV